MNVEKWQRIVAGRISQRLGDLDKTQNWLADKVGIHKTSLSAYMNGRRVPRTIEVVNIAKALDVNPGWLINVDDYVE